MRRRSTALGFVPFAIDGTRLLRLERPKPSQSARNNARERTYRSATALFTWVPVAHAPIAARLPVSDGHNRLRSTRSTAAFAIVVKLWDRRFAAQL